MHGGRPEDAEPRDPLDTRLERAGGLHHLAGQPQITVLAEIMEDGPGRGDDGARPRTGDRGRAIGPGAPGVEHEPRPLLERGVAIEDERAAALAEPVFVDIRRDRGNSRQGEVERRNRFPQPAEERKGEGADGAVRMQMHPALERQLGELRERIDGAEGVVGRRAHDRHRALGDGRGHGPRIGRVVAGRRHADLPDPEDLRGLLECGMSALGHHHLRLGQARAPHSGALQGAADPHQDALGSARGDVADGFRPAEELGRDGDHIGFQPRDAREHAAGAEAVGLDVERVRVLQHL